MSYRTKENKVIDQIAYKERLSRDNGEKKHIENSHTQNVHRSTVGEPMVYVLNQMTELIRNIQAPEVEIDKFSGDYLQFNIFLATFIEAVESKIDDPRGRLTRLIKYLDGEPKDLVQDCIYLRPDVCYKQAKKLLCERYGDSYRIINEYRKKIKDWPVVKPNDSNNLRKLLTFLIKFRSLITDKNNHTHIEMLQLLQSKVPLNIQDKWNRTAHKIRKNKRRDASLEDFIDLLQEETDIVSDPLYSREAMSGSIVIDTPNRRLKTFLASTTMNCPACSNEHDLDDCTTFLAHTVEERKDYLFKNRLCFSCYQPISYSHSARNCRQRRTCKVCKGSHPTSLHRSPQPSRK